MYNQGFTLAGKDFVENLWFALGKEWQILKCREIAKQNEQGWSVFFPTRGWIKIGSSYLRRKQTTVNKRFLSGNQLYTILYRFSRWSCCVTLELLGGRCPEMHKYLKGELFFLIKAQKPQKQGWGTELSLKLPRQIPLTTDIYFSAVFDTVHPPF